MSSSPTTATGMSLDFLADQKGLTRFQYQAANAQILIHYTSAKDISLEAGFEVASEREGWIFKTENDYVLNRNSVSKMFIQATANFVGERRFQLDDNLPIVAITEADELASLNYLKTAMEARGYLCTLWSAVQPPQLDFDFEGRPVLEITASRAVTLLTASWVGFNHVLLAKTANVYRSDPTPNAVDIGKLNGIMQQVEGILKIHNPAISSKGILRESDSELRQRMVRHNINGLATIEALEFNLLNGVLGITFAKVSQVFNTPFGKAHAHGNYIHILIEGGEEDDIVSTIAKVKAAGIPTLKTSENSLGGYYEGTREEIWFDRPVNVNIELRVYFTYNMQEATISNYEAVISQNFIEFLQNSSQNSKFLIANKFLRVLYSYPGFGASWCSVRKKGETKWQKEIQIAENERPVLNFDDVHWEQRMA
jgi:uncharacterized phage protein gp47/JayE